MDDCQLLDGRPAVAVVAGVSICQHHVDVLAEIKADADARTRRYLTRPRCRGCNKAPAGRYGGLCRKCAEARKRENAAAAYQARRATGTTGKRRGRPKVSRRATCHPDRAHVAKGLCSACYETQRREKRRAAA